MKFYHVFAHTREIIVHLPTKFAGHRALILPSRFLSFRLASVLSLMSVHIDWLQERLIAGLGRKLAFWVNFDGVGAGVVRVQFVDAAMTTLADLTHDGNTTHGHLQQKSKIQD